MDRGNLALAYIRVSVVGDRIARGRFESPDLQREAIDAWCAQHGVTIVDEIQDLNRSGGTLTRPGLASALTRIKAGEAHGIVVARSDRASRMTLHGLQLIDELDQHGAWIAAADGSIDTTDHIRRMATTMTLAMAESELRRFRAQAAVVHRRTIMEKGRQMGPAPYGYRRDGEHRLVVEPAEAAIVAHLFERRADGAGWVTLARELDEQGVRRPNGRRLSSAALSRMLRSRVYVGEAVHGEHARPDSHPAIVTEAAFQAAQRTAPPVRSDPAGTRVHPDSLLRGLLRCAGCRATLKRLPGREDKPPRWRCRTISPDRSATHDCGSPAIIVTAETADVEREVIARLMDLAEGVAAERDDGDDLADLERADREASELLDELASLEQRRALGAERWARMVDDARREKDAAGEALAVARARTRQSGGVARGTLEEAWPGMTLEEQQETLRSLVRCVMVRAGTGDIARRIDVVPVWEEVDLPRTGRSDFTARPWRRR